MIKKQKGVSLLELMVSLIIGLFLLWGLAKFYENGNKASKQSIAIANMNENARRVLSFIGNDAKLAGYIDIFDGTETDPLAKNLITGHLNAFSRLPKTGTTDQYEVPFMLAMNILNPTFNRVPPVFGCNGEFTSNLLAAPTCDGESASHGQQSIQFAYQAVGSGFSTRENKSLRDKDGESNTGQATGCDGNQINDPNGIVINRYFLDKDTLKCQSSADPGNRRFELTHGVSELMIHYGITPIGTATDNKSSLEVIKYISANDILNKSANPMGYAGIVSIDVCFVLKAVSSDGSNFDASEQDPLPSCTGTPKNRQQGDKSLYRLYRSTFAMQNLIFTE